MGEFEGLTLAGRYRIDSFLGRGGMGEVHRAWDSQRAAPVALKFLRADLAADPHRLEHFRAEARALQAVAHPHIVRCHGIEQDSGHTFIVMALVEGASLRQALFDAGGPLPLDRARGLLRPIAEALQAAHRAGIVHADLKPANVLITPDGEPVLADFGIAALAEATGQVTGTPAYAAPEQCRGEALDPRADLYSLGVMLFEMLAGERPFTGRSAPMAGSAEDKLRWEQVNASPPSPREFNPALPEAVEGVILRCLDKEPRRRYPSAMDLWAAFDQATAGIGEPAAPVPILVSSSPAPTDDDATPTPTPPPPADWNPPPPAAAAVPVPTRTTSGPVAAPPRRRVFGWLFPALGLLGLAAVTVVAVSGFGGVGGLMETVAGLTGGGRSAVAAATPQTAGEVVPPPANTATARPARTPTSVSLSNRGPTATAEWLWDFFLDNNVTWSTLTGDTVWALRGETLVETRDPYWTWMSMDGEAQDLMLGAEIAWESESMHSAAGCGFVLRLDENAGDYYVARLGRDGSASLQKVVRGEGQPELANVPVASIRTANGSTNTLVVTARGPFLTVSVNGDVVIALEDDTHRTGTAAPMTSNYGAKRTKCVFRNGGLWRMPPD